MREGSSILGPMQQRVKTDLRLPATVADRMKDLAETIGVPANAVYAMAAAQYALEFAPLTERNPRARAKLVGDMENVFNGILAEVKKTL